MHPGITGELEALPYNLCGNAFIAHPIAYVGHFIALPSTDLVYFYSLPKRCRFHLYSTIGAFLIICGLHMDT
eukprot:5025853-Ditylum_brightwellii.AAC.1